MLCKMKCDCWSAISLLNWVTKGGSCVLFLGLLFSICMCDWKKGHAITAKDRCSKPYNLDHYLLVFYVAVKYCLFVKMSEMIKRCYCKTRYCKLRLLKRDVQCTRFIVILFIVLCVSAKAYLMENIVIKVFGFNWILGMYICCYNT